MEAEIPDELLCRLSDFVAESMGLNFPPPRWPDLRRGMAAAAKALGQEADADFLRRLISIPTVPGIREVLASHLTIGETYFFRDGKAFDALAHHVLPDLLRRRRASERRLRIWSAACCTGEEPYSIAITLQRNIPDWEQWNITLLATDINPDFLRRAESGTYGEWSFRDAPPWLKNNYFRPTAEGQLEIAPRVRQMVRFAPLNLVDDVYPSLVNDTNAFDVIFCRNVLMYFTVPHAKKVLGKLHRAQVDGGWLVASAAELLHVSATPYVATPLFGTVFYRKDSQSCHAKKPSTDSSVHALTTEPAPKPSVANHQTPGAYAPSPPASQTGASLNSGELLQARHARAAKFYELGNYREAVDQLIDSAHQLDGAQSLDLLTRSLANLGRLTEALACCEQWAARDKLNPSVHYLRAALLQEQGDFDEAIRALRRALYADPAFPLAHVALANLARRRGDFLQAGRHLNHAQEALGSYEPNQLLPDSDGITAGRMAEIIGVLRSVEAPI